MLISLYICKFFETEKNNLCALLLAQSLCRQAIRGHWRDGDPRTKNAGI